MSELGYDAIRRIADADGPGGRELLFTVQRCQMPDMPTPDNGMPYYCKVCGLGFAEYLLCEQGACELESSGEALERQRGEFG